MDIVRRAELEELAKSQDHPCVTIYLPVHPAYPETTPDPIVFRNLLDEAERQLVDQGIRSPEVRSFLKPARDLQNDDTFWRSSGAKGLVALISHSVFRHHRLSYAVPESVDVGTGFYLAPLVHSLVDDVHFLLLALSPNLVRLFRGDTLGMTRVELPENVPQSEKEFEKKVETEYPTSMQYHTSSGFGKTGSLKGTPHGHGDPRDDRHEVFEDFLRTVARELEPMLKQQHLPLFLVAVEQDHPAFHNVCDYPFLQQEGVMGSPTELSQYEMFARALPLARAWSKQNLMTQSHLYEQRQATDQASDDLATIVQAAARGRVNTLFVALGERRWGEFDAISQRAAEHFDRKKGDIDLIDVAVKQCLTHGCHLFVVPADETPDQKPFSATFRW